MGVEPFAEDDFLLISAAEGIDGETEAGEFDIETLDEFAGDFVFAAFGDEAVPSDGFHAGEGEICADA